MPADLDLLRGTLDMLVLKALLWGPRHGYAVTAWIRATTENELQVDDGALYGALHRLQARGLVQSEWGLSENNRKARYYSLTVEGRKQLRLQAASWERYAQAVALVMRTS